MLQADNATTINRMTLSISTLSIPTFGIIEVIVTFGINGSDHNDTQYMHQVSLC